MSKYKEVLKLGMDLLNTAGIQEAELDAWYCMAHLTKWNRVQYFMNQESEMPKEIQVDYKKLILQRQQHIPLQYILKEQEFMGLNFFVTPSVLIPRQDTEILVEEALKVCNNKTVLDVCTGSGCIIISLKKLGNVKEAVAVDLSKDALAVAKKNVKDHMVDVKLIRSDMFDSVNGKFDIIVSNPPYIKSEEIETLMPEVKDYEPRMALDGMKDGLKFYRILAEQAANYLNKNGMVFFEIGCEQAQDVCALLIENGYSNIKVVKDYAGLDRVVSASYMEE